VVREAINGDEALDKVRHLRPDVMLIDVLMPGMNGLDVAFTIKSDPLLMDMPILLTSDVPKELIAHHVGAQHLLEKPFETEVLFQSLSALLKPQNVQVRILVYSTSGQSPEMLEDALRRKGYDVVDVATPQEPRTWADTAPLDMIILNCPASEHQHTLDMLRQEESLQHVFILLLTDSAQPTT